MDDKAWLIKLSNILVSISLKVAGAFSLLAVTFVSAKLLSFNESGYFIFLLAVFQTASLLLRFGLDNIIVKLFSNEGKDSIIQADFHVLMSFFLKISAVYFLFSLFFYMFYLEGHSSISLYEYYKIIIIIFLVSSYSLLSFLFQAALRFKSAMIYLNVMNNSLFLFLILVTFISNVIDLNLSIFLDLYLTTSLLTVIFAGIHITKFIEEEAPKVNQTALFYDSLPLFVVSIFQVATNWFGQFFVSNNFSGDELALYSIAQRMAISVSFILVAINFVISPLVARVDKTNIKLFDKYFNFSVLLGISFSLPIFLVFIFFGLDILEKFDPAYTNAFGVLLILLAGQLVNACCGSVGLFLIMLNKSTLYRNMVIISGMISISLCFMLSNLFGLYGVATSTAVAVSLLNISLFVLLKRTLKS